MSFRLSPWVRRFFFLSGFLFPAVSPSVSSAADWSQTAAVSSTLITLGLSGLVLLALYAGYLTFLFLKKALKESADAKKEAAQHAAPSAAGDKCRPLFHLVTWVCGAFGVLAVVLLLLTGFFLLIEAEMSSTRSFASLLITVGVAGFVLLALYTLFLAGMFLIRHFRGPQAEAPAHPLVAPGTTVEAALAGIPLNPEVTRRSFLSLLGWAWVVFTAASLGAVGTVLRFFFPNVTFEPPMKFKGGYPDTYSPGVDERFKDSHRVWIVRNEKGFYALSTICTHLGCTPNWLLAEQKFKCPCHGSGFYPTGINFEGPAPRPLERFSITLADDGQIEVDESVKFQYELGQWNMPGSFLEYKA